MLNLPRSLRYPNHGFRRKTALPVLVVVSILLVQAGPRVAAQQQGAAPLAQGIGDLASQLARSVPDGHPMVLAVTDFPQKKEVCGLGQFVAERLSTLLSRQPQCRLVERRRLELVLRELKFSMSDLLDPAKAKKVGQMLGVQGLVVGTITDLGKTFDVDARIIDIQSDISLPGAATSIIKDEAARQLGRDCLVSSKSSDMVKLDQGTDAGTTRPKTPQAEKPVITAVGPIRPTASQTIVIRGSGFGEHDPYNGCTSYLAIFDVPQHMWIGLPRQGTTDCKGPWGGANPAIYVKSWSDNEIVIGGLGTAPKAGDVLTLSVANAQGKGFGVSGANPSSSQVARFRITVSESE